MKKSFKKSAIACLAATIFVAAAPVMAFAAVTNEADVYSEDTAPVAIIQNSPDASTNSSSSGTTSGVQINPDASSTSSEEEPQVVVVPESNESPNTGAVSMMLPIGTALLSLGTIAVVMKKK